MNKTIKILNIVGLVIGIVAIILGITFAGYSDGMYGTRQGIQFGGDFYTEIYDMVEQTRFSVMTVGHAISQLVNAIGWAFILAGLLDVVVFAKKLLPEFVKVNAAPTAAPVAPAPVAEPAAPETSESKEEAE